MPTFTPSIHVLLQIPVHVLKDEHEFVLGVDDIVQRNDALMFQFLHQRDLSDSRRRGPFFGIEMDFFECDEFSGLAVPSFEHLTSVSLRVNRRDKLSHTVA